MCCRSPSQKQHHPDNLRFDIPPHAPKNSLGVSRAAVGPAAVAAAARASSIPRRWQHRLRPRNWMCERSHNLVPATTRRDIVQAAGASIAAAAAVLADPSQASAATATSAPMTSSGGVVTESGKLYRRLFICRFRRVAQVCATLFAVIVPALAACHTTRCWRVWSAFELEKKRNTTHPSFSGRPPWLQTSNT